MRQNVMVWGGTSGLGRELARQSVVRGNYTVITGRKVPDDHDPAHGRFIRANFSAVGDPATPGEDDVDGGFYHSALNADVLFWVAGHFLQAPFHGCSSEDIVEQLTVHLTAPMIRLRYVFDRHVAAGSPRPLHLVVVSSSSSWKTRDTEAVYGAVQAAKAQFARNLGRELPRDIPGSKVLLVCPSGMKTETFFAGTKVNTADFMDPAQVARIVWGEVDAQASPLHEMYLEGKDKAIVVTYDRRPPL